MVYYCLLVIQSISHSINRLLVLEFLLTGGVGGGGGVSHSRWCMDLSRLNEHSLFDSMDVKMAFDPELQCA